MMSLAARVCQSRPPDAVVALTTVLVKDIKNVAVLQDDFPTR